MYLLTFGPTDWKSWESTKKSWKFPRIFVIPEDSRGFLRILWSQHHRLSLRIANLIAVFYVYIFISNISVAFHAELFPFILHDGKNLQDDGKCSSCLSIFLIWSLSDWVLCVVSYHINVRMGSENIDGAQWRPGRGTRPPLISAFSLKEAPNHPNGINSDADLELFLLVNVFPFVPLTFASRLRPKKLFSWGKAILFFQALHVRQFILEAVSIFQ